VQHYLIRKKIKREGKAELFIYLYLSCGVCNNLELGEGESNEVLVSVPMLLMFLLHEAQERQGKGEPSSQRSSQRCEGSQGR
jgi:hypothetical protein